MEMDDFPADAWICEKHPDQPWPHPDPSEPDGRCAGPGMLRPLSRPQRLAIVENYICRIARRIQDSERLLAELRLATLDVTQDETAPRSAPSPPRDAPRTARDNRQSASRRDS